MLKQFELSKTEEGPTELDLMPEGYFQFLKAPCDAVSICGSILAVLFLIGSKGLKIMELRASIVSDTIQM